MCRCWLGWPGMSCTKSPAPFTIPCAFPTGFFSRDLLFLSFPFKCVARALNVLGIPTLSPRLMDPAAKMLHILVQGLPALPLVSLLSQVQRDRFKSKAWWGRTWGGLEAEWEANGAAKLRLCSPLETLPFPDAFPNHW